MTMSRSVLTSVALAATVFAAAFISPALAGCGDRPGTPTDVKVESREGAINITWRDTTKPGQGSCHDIEIKRTQNGDTSKSVTGGVCLSGGTGGSYLVSDIAFGQEYCVRLKARDHAGTQGCVSGTWSAQVCGSSKYPPFNTGGGGAPVGKEFEPGINRPGSDYKSLVLSSADPRSCQAACKRDSKCAAWTYVNPDRGRLPTRCWLKKAVPPAVANNCCTSGVPDKFVAPK